MNIQEISFDLLVKALEDENIFCTLINYYYNNNCPLLLTKDNSQTLVRLFKMLVKKNNDKMWQKTLGVKYISRLIPQACLVDLYKKGNMKILDFALSKKEVRESVLRNNTKELAPYLKLKDF